MFAIDGIDTHDTHERINQVMRKQRIRFSQGGFTLIELMIVVAVLAIISAIALPAYNGYVQTSREAVLINNISTIEIFQEDERLRNGAYLTVAANAAAIEAAIDWVPEGDEPGTTYVIAAGPGDSYEVTATSPEGTSVCLRLPDGVRC
jgi:prepilin-type N-terminal cleavage/methylation domain-containing protein